MVDLCNLWADYYLTSSLNYREILIEESNVQRIDPPVTVSWHNTSWAYEFLGLTFYDWCLENPCVHTLQNMLDSHGCYNTYITRFCLLVLRIYYRTRWFQHTEIISKLPTQCLCVMLASMCVPHSSGVCMLLQDEDYVFVNWESVCMIVLCPILRAHA